MVVSVNMRKNHAKNHLMRLQFDLLEPLLVWCFEQTCDKFENISGNFHHNCDRLWLWPLKNQFGWKWKFGPVWNCKRIIKPYKTSWKASWSQNWQQSTINVMLNHKVESPIVQPGSFKIHECIPRMFIANSKRSLMLIKVCQNKSIHAKTWKNRQN